MKKAVFSWSTGKDSALALWSVMDAGEYEIVELITTVTEGYDRVSMHGVRSALLEMQAESMGIPLRKILIPKDCTNDIYEKIMTDVMREYSLKGVDTVIFGDLFLEDIREYREKQLAREGMNAYFPIWNSDTRQVSEMLLKKGFKSVITCVDGGILSGEFAGMDYNREFIDMLPDNVDPCGENGEFHTFAYDGPLFRQRIGFSKGDVTLRDNRFYYCDLLPV